MGNALNLVDDIRVNHKRAIWCPQHFSDTYRLGGTKTKPFFRKQEYLESHSREIAKIIYQEWTKESGLFGSCAYENGVKSVNQPSIPQVTKSELARQHLMYGYQHDVWDFYRTGKDESVRKCSEIEDVINAYEEIICAEIERDIPTGDGNRKLERKTRGEVFIVKGINQYYPPTFDFKSLYLYPDILSAVFDETNSRNTGTEKQKVWIKQNDGYEYLVIGNTDPLQYKEQELGFGDREMMAELKRRVEKLIDDQTIRRLVREYYAKTSELDTNSNISKYEEERKRIWRTVDIGAKRIRGHCDECSEEYLQSHFS